MADLNQSEKDFVEQFARVLLVQWCGQTLVAESIVDYCDAGGYHVSGKLGDLCMAHALDKGWVGKSTPRKVLAKGFATAAAFLKR